MRIRSPGTAPRTRGRRGDRAPKRVAPASTAALEMERVQLRIEERDHLLAIAARVVHLGGWTIDLTEKIEYLSDEVCAIYELPLGTTLNWEEATTFYSRNPSRSSWQPSTPARPTGSPTTLSSRS